MCDKKLALLITGNEGYGVKTVYSNLIKAMADKQYIIYLIITENINCQDHYKSIDLENVIIVDIISKYKMIKNPVNRFSSLFLLLKNKFDFLLHTKQVYDFLEKNNCNRIIFQSPLYVFSYSFLGRIPKFEVFWMVPNVISSNYIFNWNKWIYKIFINLTSLKVLPNSKYTSNSFGKGVFFKKVVYPGVDLNNLTTCSLHQNKIRINLSIPATSPIFCIGASLTAIKGHEILIDSFSKLISDGIDAHLIICGGPLDGDVGKIITEKVRTLSMFERIHMVGPVQDMASYYHACDIVVSTTTIAEGYGLSIVEAMATGTPVLAHSLGAPQETVVDGKTGWLLDSLDVDTLYEGFYRVLKDKPKWRKMGLEAEERVRKNYSKETMVEQIINLLYQR